MNCTRELILHRTSMSVSLWLWAAPRNGGMSLFGHIRSLGEGDSPEQAAGDTQQLGMGTASWPRGSEWVPAEGLEDQSSNPVNGGVI